MFRPSQPQTPSSSSQSKLPPQSSSTNTPPTSQSYSTNPPPTSKSYSTIPPFTSQSYSTNSPTSSQSSKTATFSGTPYPGSSSQAPQATIAPPPKECFRNCNGDCQGTANFSLYVFDRDCAKACVLNATRSIIDICGVCGGDGTSCFTKDCSGALIRNGSPMKVLDVCGACNFYDASFYPECFAFEAIEPAIFKNQIGSVFYLIGAGFSSSSIKINGLFINQTVGASFIDPQTIMMNITSPYPSYSSIATFTLTRIDQIGSISKNGTYFNSSQTYLTAPSVPKQYSGSSFNITVNGVGLNLLTTSSFCVIFSRDVRGVLRYVRYINVLFDTANDAYCPFKLTQVGLIFYTVGFILPDNAIPRKYNLI